MYRERTHQSQEPENQNKHHSTWLTTGVWRGQVQAPYLFPAPGLESVSSSKSSGFIYWRMVFGNKGLDVFSLLLSTTASRPSQHAEPGNTGISTTSHILIYLYFCIYQLEYSIYVQFVCCCFVISFTLSIQSTIFLFLFRYNWHIMGVRCTKIMVQ